MSMKFGRRVVRLYFFILCVFTTHTLRAGEHFVPPERGFISVTPAKTWEQGLISGNGTIGANMMSRPLDETVIFTHERLFLPQGKPHKPRANGDRLFEIRNMIDRGLYQQAADLAFEMSEQEKLIMPDCLVPAFDMTISTLGDAQVEDYVRSVNFETGETLVRWRGEKGWYERRVFVSRADGFAVMKLTAPTNYGVKYKIGLRTTIPSDSLNARQLEWSYRDLAAMVADAKSSVSGRSLRYSYRFTKAFPGGVQGVEGMAYIHRKEGSMTAEGASLIVEGAKEIIIFIDVRPKFDPKKSQFADMDKRLAGVAADYDSLLKRHAAIHGELFNRIKLNLGGDPKDHQLPTEKLIELSRANDEPNKALIEKLFDAGRYNIISATGELPPVLQGVWGGTFAPWWNCAYTHNGNIQAAIGANLTGNMPELMWPYFSYLESMTGYYEINARNLMGCRGIMMPAHSSSHGFVTQINDWFPGAFWVSGAPWAARFFYDYYQYTGDKDFLRNHALPFMEKTAHFFEDYLYPGPDGKYMLSPAQSPENTPLNTGVQASFNATMDVAAAREIFRNMISVSRELGINSDKIQTWEAIIAKLPDYMIDADGILKEWLTPKLVDRIDHRHASQLYALYFEADDEFDQRPDLREAVKKLVAQKMDWRDKDHTSGNMPFGIVQLGQAATSLGDSELAYRCLKYLVNKPYWYNNLASTHNYNDRFNMDISGGMPSVIMKMLVESRPGRIKILPALPAAWNKGKVEGLLCSGQVEVNALSWDKHKIQLTLTSNKDQSVILQFPGDVKSGGVKFVPGNTRQIEVDLPAGKAVTMAVSL
ncbi:glycoside hydrolase N-terminal domain-containing protein [Ereboglobus sp. PH5-5]|uniref:glycosyl hydrolase family 95 catalytic domain-containing protein n=1 Tax=Ereboglobus sp. PH5-5 TaxID=2940529 RepID=UPI0024052C19|nr:glycoside hydrolase N-terminal domain-containing protein [Ereboglobus sp. PH5-5]